MRLSDVIVKFNLKTMRAVKMYIINVIIFIMLVMTTQGSIQYCRYYCKLVPAHLIFRRPECDCALYNLRKTRSTVKSNLHIRKSSEVKEGLTLNVKPNSTKHNNIQHDSKSSSTYKRSDNNFQKIIEDKKELPMALYLDLDLNTNENITMSKLEELKNMFRNISTNQKDLSECIHVYIYIFSKYIDKTNTSLGHRVKHDEVSTSQILTEIENKCDPPAAIIKQSIYQIKESLPRKAPTSESAQEAADAMYEHEEPYETRSYESLPIDLFSTSTNYPINHVDKVTFETDILTQNNKSILQKSIDEVALNYNDDLAVTMKNSLTSAFPILSDKEFMKTTSTYRTDIAITNTTESRVYEDLRTASVTSRSMYDEVNILIPKIITTELSNGTIKSVVDGYEKVPNSDFTTISTDSTTLNENIIQYNLNDSTSSLDLLKTDIENNNDKSALKEIHGNLYFLFGKKQIPARFIQQQDGELNVALDGFSLCDQMLEENTSTFMNLLCSCIHLQNRNNTAL